MNGRFVFENEKNVSEADEWTAKAREEGCGSGEEGKEARSGKDARLLTGGLSGETVREAASSSGSISGRRGRARRESSVRSCSGADPQSTRRERSGSCR